jgi:small subunit ribosomal protein S14
MKYLVAKNKKNRFNYKLFEKKRLLLNSIYKNNFLLNKYKKYAKNKLIILKGYKSYLKNYCIISGRSRGIIRKYNISRMLFKYYGSFGYLKGIKKGSW